MRPHTPRATCCLPCSALGLLDSAHAAAIRTCAPPPLQALDAYPEAYCDFKKLLTLLLYAKLPEASQPPDVREAMGHASRQELAQLVDHTVRQHTGEGGKRWRAACDVCENACV